MSYASRTVADNINYMRAPRRTHPGARCRLQDREREINEWVMASSAALTFATNRQTGRRRENKGIGMVATTEEEVDGTFAQKGRGERGT